MLCSIPKNIFKIKEFFFIRIKRKAIFLFCEIFKIYPTSKPYLSGDTFRSFATIIYSGHAINLVKSEIIFVQSDLLKNFQNHVNKIKRKFILISSNGDDLVDKRYQKILDNKYLLKWFASNTIIKNNKVIPIPLGIQNSRYHHFGVINDFNEQRIQIKQKLPKILCSFDIATNPKKRKLTLKVLSKIRLVDAINDLTAYEYREKLKNYMFQACPEGNGLDTYRVWESMYLNVIPIVIKNKFYSQLENFPSLILNDWSELELYTKNDLKKIYTLNLKKLNECKYIWFDYWNKKVNCIFKSKDILNS